MTIARTILSEASRSFDLGGRTARADYLWFLFFSVVAFAASLALCIRFLPADHIAAGIYTVTAIFYLPITAAGARRLHDVGESGKLMLDPLKPAMALGVVLLLVALAAESSSAVRLIAFIAAFFFGTIVVALLLIASLTVTIMTLAYFSNTMGMLLLPPQPGPNKYGPNPNEVPQ